MSADLEVKANTDNHADDSNVAAHASTDPDLPGCFRRYMGGPARMEWNCDRWRTELLMGLTVAFAQVPEAIAFSFVADVKPYVGLTAAWIIGLVTASTGGRPAMICGATGAIAAVQTSFVKEHGTEKLFYAVILMGILQIIAGLLNCGKLVRMIPHPVMLGFCNGLALVIGLSQFNSFKEVLTDAQKAQYDDGSHSMFGTHNFSPFTDDKPWVGGGELWWALLQCAMAFGLCMLLPLISHRIPARLIALVWCTGFEHYVLREVLDHSGTITVGDVASVSGDMPLPVWLDSKYTMADVDTDLIVDCLPLAIRMGLIGLLESLMTLELIGEITQTKVTLQYPPFCILRWMLMGRGTRRKNVWPKVLPTVLLEL